MKKTIVYAAVVAALVAASTAQATCPTGSCGSNEANANSTATNSASNQAVAANQGVNSGSSSGAAVGNTTGVAGDIAINVNIDQSADDGSGAGALGSAENPETINTSSSNHTVSESTSHAVTDSTVRYSGEYSIKNVPNVAAPALTTTLTETCMGSTSAGGAGLGWGFSIGTTWRDTACVRRLDARELKSLGYPLAAKELMCDSEKVREALRRAGKPCYDDLPDAQKRPEDRAPQKTAASAPATTAPSYQPKKQPPQFYGDF